MQNSTKSITDALHGHGQSETLIPVKQAFLIYNKPQIKPK